MLKGENFVKHKDLIQQMTLEEKCYLLSGKDFWQTRSVERLGVPSMALSSDKRQDTVGRGANAFRRPVAAACQGR